MQATMLPFPYSLSCPPFLDMSDGMTTSPSAAGTPSPPAISYVSRFYDSMFVTATASDASLRQTPVGNSFTPHSTSVAAQRGFKQNIARKKSFTIEAILGLNSYAEERQQDHVKDNLGPTRISDHRRHDRLASPAPYSIPSATPRSALTTMSTVFSSPTSTETSPVKGSKMKSPQVNAVKDTSAHCSNLNRLSTSGHTSPKSSNPVCASLVGSQKTNGSGGATGKAKRIRTIFTPEQLERLESEFERQQYMVGPERLYLASTLSLTEAQVKVWFQNRRIKWRKQHLEMQQARLAQLRAEAERDNCETTTEVPTSHHSDVTTTAWTDLLDDRK